MYLTAFQDIGFWTFTTEIDIGSIPCGEKLPGKCIYIWADGFSGVPRISPVLGRTVSGSTFRLHLSHLFLDLFLLLVKVNY